MAFAEERKKKARVNRFQPARLRQSHAGGEQGKQTVKQQQVCSQWDRRVDRDRLQLEGAEDSRAASKMEFRSAECRPTDPPGRDPVNGERWASEPLGPSQLFHNLHIVKKQTNTGANLSWGRGGGNERWAG